MMPGGLAPLDEPEDTGASVLMKWTPGNQEADLTFGLGVAEFRITDCSIHSIERLADWLKERCKEMRRSN
jgi:hypothetical protein